MTPRSDPIPAFLDRLRRALRTLPAADRTAIVNEIGTHIADRSSAGGNDPAGVLVGLGDPDALARAFLDAHGVSVSPGATAQPWTSIALARTGRGLRTGADGVLAAVMAAFTLGFLLVAVLKPFAPSNVGLWTGPRAFAFGVLSAPGAPQAERLGLWIIPLAAAGAFVCALLAAACVRRLASPGRCSGALQAA